jgi:phage terminase large subunit-like protein
MRGNGHHPKCKNYASKPADPRFQQFGEEMWKYIVNHEHFCWEEISEDILPLAEKAGLCERVVYDSRIHGDIEEAEDGCEIWWWGKSFACGMDFAC